MDIEKAAALFKALGDENRLSIMKLLTVNDDLCACHILDELEVSQPTLSHHMKILKDAGLVSARKQGRWMHYSINSEALQEATEKLSSFSSN